MSVGGALTGWLDALERLATSRAKAGLTRRLRPRPADDSVVDLAGNDYLGLAAHPAVIGASVRALHEYGLGATGSRLVRGSTDAHAQLESSLADWLGAGAALVFSSGYLANLAAVRGLAATCDLVVSDAYNHASLIDGCKISGLPTVVAPHNDPAAVAAILDAHPGRRAVVVTESVFSVDGDLAPLAALHAVTSARGALLLVDDAHALGVLGPRGAGGVTAAGLAGLDDVIVTATLSKSLGGAGGVVAGPAPFIRHLIDTGRTFIYDTAPPPAVVAGVLAAIEITQAADDRRALLAARARQTVTVLRAAGLTVSVPAGAGPQAAGPAVSAPADAALRDAGPTASASADAGLQAAGLTVSVPAGAVLSVPAPGPEAALNWAADCRDRGVAVGCFRPPSTPDGSSRLRLTLNAGVSDADFARALTVIVECAP